jgi:hypothetical protein
LSDTSALLTRRTNSGHVRNVRMSATHPAKPPLGQKPLPQKKSPPPSDEPGPLIFSARSRPAIRDLSRSDHDDRRQWQQRKPVSRYELAHIRQTISVGYSLHKLFAKLEYGYGDHRICPCFDARSASHRPA